MADPESSRLVVIPDTDGDLADALGLLEEVLLHLQPYEPDDEPAPPGLGADELHALQRIAMRIYAEERAETPDLYTPDGTFNYPPLRFVTLLSEDLDVVGTAIAALGAALAFGDDGYARHALNNFQRGRQTPEELIVRLAQTHATLDLAVDDDTRLLARTLIDKTGRVVLTPDQNQAYRRYTDRILALNLDNPFDRYLYRGI